MTIRSHNGALQHQMYRRAQTLCTLFEVRRLDGFVLRFTDHDRPLDVEGDEYLPIGLGSVTAERLDSGLRSGDQEAGGVLSDVDDPNEFKVIIPDLLGNKYRGATVWQRVIDWRRPWITHYAATKTVRQVKWDGSSWIATLEGFGARLQQEVGGHLGGTFSITCPKSLGSRHVNGCHANLVRGLLYGDTATSHAIISGSTALLLKQTGASWTTDQFAGFYAAITSGDQAGEEREVVSNTSDTLFLASALSDTPDVGVTFMVGDGMEVVNVSDARMEFNGDTNDINAGFGAPYATDFFRDGEIQWLAGDNAGTVSPIVQYQNGTPNFTLLFPAPFDIAIGDKGIVRVGCDGLRGTCQSKFSPVGGGVYVGTATSGTSTTLTDSGAPFPGSNALAGFRVEITAGTGANQTPTYVTSNTTTAVTVSPAFETTPDATSVYRIAETNILNFGGSPYDPGAGPPVEQPE